MRARLAPSLEAVMLLAITLPAALLTHEPSLWFLVPFAHITLQRRDYTDYGLDLSSRRQWGGLRFHLITSALVFIPYAVGHYALARWLLGQHFHLAVPDDFHWLLVSQVIGIALPEEFFFRGYLQSQLNRTLPRPFTVFGARCGAGLPLAALLFALCHVPLGGITQLSVFFPGLLYGWLRERSNSVVVPTLYHAASNILLKTMLVSLS